MTKLERQTRYLLLVEKFEGSDTATIAWQMSTSVRWSRRFFGDSASTLWNTESRR